MEEGVGMVETNAMVTRQSGQTGHCDWDTGTMSGVDSGSEGGTNERLGSNAGWRRRDCWVSVEESWVERNMRSGLGWMMRREGGWRKMNRTMVWQWGRGSGADNGWSRSGHTPHWCLIGGDVVWHS